MKPIRSWFRGSATPADRARRTAPAPPPHTTRRRWPWITAVAVLVVALAWGWSFYWSREPALFWVVAETPAGERTVVGYSTVHTLIDVMDWLSRSPAVT